MIDPFAEIATLEADPFELNAEVPVGILSPSSISTFLRCPEQFRREYVTREKRAPGGWGIAGSAFHDARRHALRFQMRSGQEITEDRLLRVYQRAWDKRVADEGEVSWGKDSPAVVKERGWGMTLEYHVNLGREVRPIRMEFGVKGYVDGVPVPIYGRVDVETDEEIIDTKTGKQLFHKLKPEFYVQGILYVYMTGKPIRWHSVSEKPATTTNDELRIAPRPKVLDAAELIARRAYDGIIHQLREYGREGPWAGHGPASGVCRYCSFRGRCPYVPD